MKKSNKKKTSRKAKSFKQTIKKSAPKVKGVQSQALMTVSVADLVAPERESSKFSLVKSPITNVQILKMLQRTPPQYIKQRPGKGGGTWDYVPGAYMKKVLNYVFGWLWNFEVVDKGIAGESIWVQGRLTILDPKTLKPVMVKDQFGGADIKFRKNTKIYLDYPNDLKAAATDALKKCAAELGIASDIYGKNEFKDMGYEVQEDKTAVSHETPRPAQNFNAQTVEKSPIEPTAPKKAKFKCENCGREIQQWEDSYSRRMFKKSLCRNCQKKGKK